LGEVAKNDKVNVEVDMIARYLNRLLEAQAGQTKYERSFAYAKQT